MARYSGTYYPGASKDVKTGKRAQAEQRAQHKTLDIMTKEAAETSSYTDVNRFGPPR